MKKANHRSRLRVAGKNRSYPGTRSMREALDALEWARREVMRTYSPDFIRQRVGEDRIQLLIARLLRETA